MSKEKGKTQNKKRKLTRQEKKQIDALIRQSKGDGKPHTAQDSIPFERMYKDGICRLANGRYAFIAHTVQQRVKLPPPGGFLRIAVREEKLIYRNRIPGYKVIEYL